MILYCIFVLALATTVYCDGVSLLHPCYSTDIDCLSRSTEMFLERTAGGMPQYGFKSIDPLIVPSLDVVVDDHMGLVYHFKDMNVTGLRKQSISDFRMDKEAKSVVLKTKADLHVAAVLTIELKKESKFFTGPCDIDSTVLGTAQYGYSFRTDDKNVQYFEVGPETISCEVPTEPNFVLGSDLQALLLKDNDAGHWKPYYLSHRAELRKKVMCEITKTVYVDVVNNIRAAAKILPKSDFFLDV